MPWHKEGDHCDDFFMWHAAKSVGSPHTGFSADSQHHAKFQIRMQVVAIIRKYFASRGNA